MWPSAAISLSTLLLSSFYCLIASGTVTVNRFLSFVTTVLHFGVVKWHGRFCWLPMVTDETRNAIVLPLGWDEVVCCILAKIKFPRFFFANSLVAITGHFCVRFSRIIVQPIDD